MSLQHVCAVDVGSTRIKASVRDREGRAITSLVAPYPRGGSYDEVWGTFADAVRRVCADQAPTAMIIAAQMSGLTLIQQDGTPLGRPHSSVDTPAGSPAPFDTRRSGCAVGHMTTSHALSNHLRAHPGLPEGTRIGGIKEFLLLRLTGEWVTDPASACATGFYDLAAADWSSTSRETLSIEAAALPAIHEPDAVIGPLTPQAARDCDLPPETPVYCGIGDGPAANLSVGAVSWGTICLSQGTTTVARMLGPAQTPPWAPPDCFIHHVRRGWYGVGVRALAGPGDDPTAIALGIMSQSFPLRSIYVTGGGTQGLDDPRAVRVPADWADGTRGLALIVAGTAFDESAHPFRQEALQ